MPVFQGLTEKLVAFRDARDWAQFHTPKNLSGSICIEAAELLEVMQWAEGPSAKEAALEKRSRIQEEVADVAIYTLLLCHELDIDLEAAILSKLALNEERYPVARENTRSSDPLDGAPAIKKWIASTVPGSLSSAGCPRFPGPRCRP